MLVEIIENLSIALHVSHCSSSRRMLAGITSQPSSILYGGVISTFGHAPIHALFTQGVTGDQNSEPSVGYHASISQLALTLPVFSGEMYGSLSLTTKMRSFLRLFRPPLGASMVHYSQTCARGGRGRETLTCSVCSGVGSGPDSSIQPPIPSVYHFVAA